jgi:ribose transport system permease protein
MAELANKKESAGVMADKLAPDQFSPQANARQEDLGGPPEGSRRRSGRHLTLVLRVTEAGPLLVLLVIWMIFALLSPVFLTKTNLLNVLVQSSSTGLLALGALLAVIVGALDLSLGATMGLASVVGAVILKDFPSAAWLAIPIVLLVGLAIGAINGFVIVTLKIGNAFIVTLGMMFAVLSVSQVLAGSGQVPGFPAYIVRLASGKVLGIPGPVILTLVVAGLVGFFLNRVTWGRWIVAVGGSPDAAVKSGIPMRRVLFSVYVLASLMAVVAGILVGGLNDAGTPDSGQSILLAYAAVVLGGAKLTGGRGSVWATLVGAVTLATITNGLTLMSVSPNWTAFAIGAALVVAVGIDKLRNMLEDGVRLRQAKLETGTSS